MSHRSGDLGGGARRTSKFGPQWERRCFLITLRSTEKSAASITMCRRAPKLSATEPGPFPTDLWLVSLIAGLQSDQLQMELQMGRAYEP